MVFRSVTKSLLNNVTKNKAYLYKSMSTSKEANEPGAPSSNEKEVNLSSKVTSSTEVAKEDLQWKTPWHEKEGQYYSFLRSFYSDQSHTSLLRFLQTPVNLSPASIKKWWLKRMEIRNIGLQQYIPERNHILGNELAAAHFIVYRGGAVKFHDDDKWIKADDSNRYELPKSYDSEKILQAIDCETMDLYYEGLVNLRDLKKVEWLSLNGSEIVDDWFIDSMTNIFSETLIYLDIRDCPNITYRGLGAIYKLKKLKILYVDELLPPSAFELTCMMLQDISPDLDIRFG